VNLEAFLVIVIVHFAKKQYIQMCKHRDTVIKHTDITTVLLPKSN